MWNYYWGMRHDMGKKWIILIHTMYRFDLLLINWYPVIINAQLGLCLVYLLFAHPRILFRSCQPGLAKSSWSTSYNVVVEGSDKSYPLNSTTLKGFTIITMIRIIMSRNYVMPLRARSHIPALVHSLKNKWVDEWKKVVSCAHPPQLRTGIPHGWVFRIMYCARTGAKGLAVLTVRRRTCVG